MTPTPSTACPPALARPLVLVHPAGSRRLGAPSFNTHAGRNICAGRRWLTDTWLAAAACLALSHSMIRRLVPTSTGRQTKTAPETGAVSVDRPIRFGELLSEPCCVTADPAGSARRPRARHRPATGR